MKTDGVDPTVQVLRTVLGQASRRVQVVASNLANLDTPGYRAVDVIFPDPSIGRLRLEVARSDSAHLSTNGNETVHGTLIDAPATRTGNDGNTVDVDREMTRLAMSAGRYRTAAEMLRKRFALLAYAASDGRQGMSLHDAVAIGATGLTAQRIRMETITSNLTNAQSTRGARGEPYRRVRPLFLAEPLALEQQTDPGRTLYGVRVASIQADPSPFEMRHEPGHPDADARGYVAYPNVDPVREMVDMLSATRSYEAQVTLIRSIRDMMQSALQILA